MGANPRPLVGLLVAVLLLSSVSFAVDVSDNQPGPVPFEATTEGGLPAAAQTAADASDAVLPRAEAFYTQYQYPVGYVGIPFFLNDLHKSARSMEFGQLRTAYVSDFAYADAHLDGNGTLVASYEASVDRVPARDAYFVVDSRARTVGETAAIVPFSERDAAASFARRYDGSVVRWESLRERRYDRIERTERDWQRLVERRQAWADRTVSRARQLTRRPVSVVVGRDAPTLQRAIDRARPNTTVRLPPGQYDVDSVRVGKPLTIRGAGTTDTVVSGDGNGSVFNVTGDRVAITNLNVTGIGEQTDVGRTLVGEDYPYYKMRSVYGTGASGIVFSRASGALVANVSIDTPTNGVVIRESPQTVVQNATIYAPPATERSSHVVSVVGSPRTVVQDSELWGGFHSLMVVDMREIVVRGIYAEGAVTGFHTVYAGQALVTDSTFRDMFKSVMSALESFGNAAIDNDVRNSAIGIDFAGSRSYVARNTLVHNRVGLFVERRATLYADNVIGYNYAGVTVGDAFPTNHVTGNDFVGNDRHAWVQSKNVLYVWGETGTGNYWADVPGLDRDGDGFLDHDVVPTGPASRLSYRTDGGDALARSPAVALTRSLQGAVPGLRSNGILDIAPLASPSHPRELDRLASNYSAAGPYRPAGDSDPYDYHAEYDIPHSANDTFG